MKNLSISELGKFLGVGASVASSAAVSGVAIDSRAVKAGDCFIAIKGANHDGHDYVEGAIESGAACAIVDKDFKAKGAINAPVFYVEDTVLALGKLAQGYRRGLTCTVIGITGSAGKTTTRQIMSHVLGKHMACHTAIKSFNNNIGLPLTLLGIEEHHQVAVVELGTNHVGEIRTLTRIAGPDIAVITNAYDAHIEHFGSVEAIIKEKASIAEGLGEDGVLIINRDSAGLEKYCKKTKRVCITYGKSDKAAVYATEIELTGFASRFKIEGVQVELPLPGKGNVDNALGAWAVCRRMGISARDFAAGLRDLAGVSMRLEPIAVGKMTLISDCYNANPASMRNALELLKHVGTGQKRRLVFICGPMMELGQHSESLHGELGIQTAEAGVGLLLATGPFAERVAAAAEKTAGKGIETHCFKNTEELGNIVCKFLKADDIVLVKGSRGAKLETVVEKVKGG